MSYPNKYFGRVDMDGVIDMNSNDLNNILNMDVAETANFNGLISTGGGSWFEGLMVPPSGAGADNFLGQGQNAFLFANVHDTVNDVNGTIGNINAQFDLQASTAAFYNSSTVHQIEIIRGSGSQGAYSFPKRFQIFTQFDIDKLERVRMEHSTDGGSTYSETFEDTTPQDTDSSIVYNQNIGGPAPGNTNAFRITIETNANGTLGVRHLMVFTPNEPNNVRYLLHRQPENYGDEVAGMLTNLPMNQNGITDIDFVGMDQRPSDPSAPSTGKGRIWQGTGAGTGADGELVAEVSDSTGTTRTNTLLNNARFSGYLSTEQTNAENGIYANFAENVPLNQDFTVVSNSEIDVDQPGLYEISFNTHYHRESTGTSGRNIMFAELEVNGTAMTDRTRATVYIRNNGDGDRGDCKNTVIMDLAANDTIRLNCGVDSGAETGNSLERATMNIKKIGN